MGVVEDLRTLYPDGIPVELNGMEILSKVQEAGERLSDESFQASKEALDRAISQNEKIKVCLAVVKMATSLGMKFI